VYVVAPPLSDDVLPDDVLPDDVLPDDVLPACAAARGAADSCELVLVW
jgi:hypothetical protein